MLRFYTSLTLTFLTHNHHPAHYITTFYGICTLLDEWRHFVSSKTLLCFRARAGVSRNAFSVKRVFEQV